MLTSEVQTDAIDLLNQSILCLLNSALFEVAVKDEKSVIETIKSIPGMNVKVSEVIKDESEPTEPGDIIIVTDYKGFLTFGCCLEYMDTGWRCKELFYQNLTEDAFEMLQLIYGIETTHEKAQDDLATLTELFYSPELLAQLSVEYDDEDEVEYPQLLM